MNSAVYLLDVLYPFSILLIVHHHPRHCRKSDTILIKLRRILIFLTIGDDSSILRGSLIHIVVSLALKCCRLILWC